MLGWSLLFPAFLAGAIAAVVPVALHLWSHRTAPTVPFGATRLLSRSPVESARRRRLRDWLLLALRIAALVLLAVAFARPFRAAGAVGAAAPATIVALDRSASLGGAERFAAATSLALAAVDAAPAGQLVGVLTFDDESVAVVPPTVDREAARRAIRAARAGYGATEYAAAITGSVAAMEGRPGRIVVVTDLQRGGWEGQARPGVPPGISVEVVDVGPVRRNLGVTDLRIDDGRLIASVTAHGLAAATATLTLSIDGTMVERMRAEVPGDGVSDVTFARPVPETGELRVAVHDADGLPADDDRFLLRDRPEAVRVLVIGRAGRRSEAAFFVERALRTRSGAPPLDVRVTDHWTGEAQAWDGEPIDVVVLVAGTATEVSGRALRDHVERGGGLLVVLGPALEARLAEQTLGASVGQATGAGDDGTVTLAPTDTRHPVFRPFRAMTPAIGHARFERHAVVKPGEGDRVLARFSDGDAALVERASGRGRMLVFGSDLGGAWNDLPLRSIFVPFVHELVGFLAPEARPSSAYVVGQVPEGLEARPGIVAHPQSGRRIAVNVDPRESIVSRQTVDEFMAAIASAGGRVRGPVEAGAVQREAGQSYWRLVLLIVLMVVTLEGFVGRRAMGRT